MTRKKAGFQSIHSVLRDVARLDSFEPLERTFLQNERTQLVRRGLSAILSPEVIEKIVNIRINQNGSVYLDVRHEGIYRGLDSNRRQIASEMKKTCPWIRATYITIIK